MVPETPQNLEDQQTDTPSDWRGRLLQSPLLQALAPANLQRVFNALEPVELRAGQTLLSPGERSDFYYVVAAGEASVSRAPGKDGRRLSLGTLGPGDAFGHVPLITGEPWSTRVRWKQDGTVMRLPAAVFRGAICAAVLRGVAPQAAAGERAAGAAWLDVREPAAYQRGHLDDALNLPLGLLPWLCPRLSRARTYITCAEIPAVAAAAAFELIAAGHQAAFLAAPWSSLDTRRREVESPLPAELEALIARRVQAREAVLRSRFASAWARREEALHAAYARVLAEVAGASGRGATQETGRGPMRLIGREGPVA